jgi:hypothetical protein
MIVSFALIASGLATYAQAQEASTSATVQGKGKGCTREALIAARDGFFAGSPKLAAGAKIALNQKIVTAAEVPKLGGFTNFKVEAIDSEICNIATFRMSSTQLISVRLKINAEGGSISEVDILQAVSGDQFFRPTGFPSTTPAILGAKQAPGPAPNIPAAWTERNGTPKEAVNAAQCKQRGPSRLLNRKELVYVASTYADGLHGKPWDSCILGTGSCPRIENGVQTTGNCAVGAGAFGFDVRGRRWIADTETGVVLGIFYFDYASFGQLAANSGVNLFLHEYIKVNNGGLAYIYAPMKNMMGGLAKANLWQ